MFDALPICLDTKDPDKIVETVRILQPSFAAINLEDISSQKCYDIEDRLKEICDIPIFHDDQHGTAIALCSAVIGALRFVKKDIKTVRIVVNGCGAAGSAIGRLLVNMGAENVIMVDRFGALYDGIEVSLDRVQAYLQKVTNKDKVRGNLADVAKGADVLIGVSAPGVFTKEIIASMNKTRLFRHGKSGARTNVRSCIDSRREGSGTGRQRCSQPFNNVTVSRGFRGAVDVRATAITEEMK